VVVQQRTVCFQAVEVTVNPATLVLRVDHLTDEGTSLYAEQYAGAKPSGVCVESNS